VAAHPGDHLRGTFAKGFRRRAGVSAANSGVPSFNCANDDARCPFTGLPTDCGFGGASAVAQGDPTSPETSRSIRPASCWRPFLRSASRWTGGGQANPYEIKRISLTGVCPRPGAGRLPQSAPDHVSLVAPYRNLGQDEPKGIDFEFSRKHGFGPGPSQPISMSRT